MHTTIRHYEGVTDTGEVVRSINEGFVPIIRDIRGFVNYSVIDAGGGTLITISTFEDRSGAEESDNRSWEWTREQNLDSLIPNRPQITAGEVAVHESS
jgi:hypothetical protein